ncbi:GNAT family N-acetyltransferase [Vibrio algarum]|uniref:tRNA(Met) cytidine acetyltransferase TmcA n=1 Tax=Vibrio algarum TaxID=3020714 RepID=A0ABT4YVP3_9VIBR|nr:GNAT family N-acetyltransferase [Vibrio sp. KJ40-1]MDB1125652.1 GNAT family N-acetyltransferase [Vibrio sp. KJ40-1]
MNSPLSYLQSLISVAKNNGHRYLVRLNGEEEWQDKLLESVVTSYEPELCFKLGGRALVGSELLNFKRGSQLLGRNVECLIYDDKDGFDANSFTAASGALAGGGILFLLLSNKNSAFYRWLDLALTETITLKQYTPTPSLPRFVNFYEPSARFDEQEGAIHLIKKVFSGRRKRPLILTADRGRGKSSALGIAAAQLINSSQAKIVVTAPSRKAVDPVFTHAKQHLHSISYEGKNALLFNESFIQFVSPDELIRTDVECDVVLVDEASAIPVSMLQKLISKYHRMVFSSTIHGYEGCGRGFTVKFFKWLDENRPGWKKYHLQQPIRWKTGDPLESWVFNTFLLDSEMPFISHGYLTDETQFTCVKKERLLQSPALFKQIFALLVSAHYQTSPNDIMQILDDDTVHLFIYEVSSQVVGCIVAKIEGELAPELIDDVLLGKRRPKGHLCPVVLVGKMGFSKAAEARSLRVMRIAVAQDCQNLGIGSKMLSFLKSQNEVQFDFVSTSYGVTEELYRFWVANEFYPVRLGSSLDQASGTYSILMLSSIVKNDWEEQVRNRFPQDFVALLPEGFKDLPALLVLNLLKSSRPMALPVLKAQVQLVRSYIQGGSGYENIAYTVCQLLIENIAHKDIHPILVTKILQKKSWTDIVEIYSMSGRKQAECLFRKSIEILV